MCKKISVVGANSYIARNFICYLNDKNVQLFLYDYQKEHLDGKKNYTQIDVLNKESIRQIRFDVDVIYMFVGKTGTAIGFDNPEKFIDINEKSLLYLLNEYRNHEMKAKVVFPSSRLIYRGNTAILTEEANKEAKTIYAMNKLACEQYLCMYHRMYNLPYCILRICVPYGSLVEGATSYGTAEFMIENAQKGNDITLYGNGEVRRTFTYITDLCEILLHAGLEESVINDAYNVGGIPYSLLEVANMISQKYSVKTKFVPWPTSAYLIESGDTVFDSQKLDGVLEKSNYATIETWIKCLGEK